jgi:sec-independent protein translocase protein TatC
MQDEILSSVWVHLDELRSTLIKIAWVILLGCGITLFFHQSIIDYLKKPLDQVSIPQEIKTFRFKNSGPTSLDYEIPLSASNIKSLDGEIKHISSNQYTLPSQSEIEWQEASSHRLYIMGPIEAFSTTLKICFWLGLTVTSPIWFYFILQYITPALHQNERVLIVPFLFLSIIFISGGLFFAYNITLPLANHYLTDFNRSIGTNLWSFSNYIDYTLVLLAANAVAFELFALLFILVHLRVIKLDQLKNKRKEVILAAFILGALLTPPDVLSQLLLAIPLIFLYEAAIGYAYLRKLD